ncbi:MAG: exodeoxyribonuclease VII small subunit [Bacteroidales bacterium]|jgi:Exonuclease VII small subunit|nr:exodeoxyribonuclease VII small subunit [Bacteroidales bacterium]
MAKETITYTEALAELQQIVSEMENADIPVDELSDKIKRCTLLIKLCKDKLTKTEAEIAKIMETES